MVIIKASQIKIIILKKILVIQPPNPIVVNIIYTKNLHDY